MVDPAATFESFVSMWAQPGSANPASEQALTELESHFAVRLPAAYREFMLRYGSVYTPEVLSAITEGGHELSDVQNFLPVPEIIEATEAYVSAGMPAGYLAFASDCMGNLFCFKLDECSSQPLPDAPVWLFDHDFVEIDELEGSFVDWLSKFTALSKGSA